MKDRTHAGYGIYWRTWLLLLALTMGMAFLDRSAISRTALVWILVLAMLIKASLIGAYFMHLRFEKASLVLTVAAGLLLTAAALFFLIAPDGIRVLERSP